MRACVCVCVYLQSIKYTSPELLVLSRPVLEDGGTKWIKPQNCFHKTSSLKGEPDTETGNQSSECGCNQRWIQQIQRWHGAG